MAKGTLAVSVTLRDPKTHKLVSFAVGDKPPKWAKDAITNPAAWEGKVSAAPASGVRAVKAAEEPDTGAEGAGGTDTEDEGATGTQEAQDGQESQEEEAVSEPARAGKGSSLSAWQSYVDLLGIEYDEDATRDDLIELVDAAAAAKQ